MSERSLEKWIVFIVFIAFIFGAYLLENIGVKYVSDGGSPIVKIHIYSYVSILVFVFCIMRIGFFDFIRPLKELRKTWLLSCVCLLLVILYGFFRFGTSGLAYLIDAISIPLLLVALICRLSDSAKNKILSLLSYLIFFNACVAIIEIALGRNIIAPPFESIFHFRSTAFLAHSLNNSLITAALTPLLMRYTRIPNVIYITVIVLALFSFGGRAALGIFILGNFLLIIPRLKVFLGEGFRYSKLKFALLQALAYFSIICVILTILFSPIGERILSKLHMDNSAEARLDAFILLDQLSVFEWLFGASHGLLNDIAFYIGINVVENYLIGWVLNFGIFGCLGLIFSVYIIPFMLACKQDLTTKIVLLSFIFISVTNNALTVKTPALIFLVVVLSCHYRSSNQNTTSI
ncbi:TPA: VpsF family polysaccharide biosynthesis protein [Vibrio metoecus]